MDRNTDVTKFFVKRTIPLLQCAVIMRLKY